MSNLTAELVYIYIFVTAVFATLSVIILFDIWIFNRNIQIKIIWTLVIIFVPIFGSIFYLYLNQNRPYFYDYESID